MGVALSIGFSGKSLNLTTRMFVVASLWFSLPGEKLKAPRHKYTALEEKVKSTQV
jgi:hypothetical protein